MMQFGTTNTPAYFQGYIKIGIRKALHDFASAYYLDGVLINSDSEEDHVGHIKWIMQW